MLCKVFLIIAAWFAKGATEADFFLISNDHEHSIHQVDVKTGQVTLLKLPFVDEPSGISYDSKRGRAIWLDKQGISACKLDGTDYVTLDRQHDHYWDSKSVYDEASDVLFYNSRGSMRAMNLGTIKQEKLLTTSSLRYGQIALDKTRRFLYYIDRSERQVRRVKTDGSADEMVFIVPSPKELRGLALDFSGNAVFVSGKHYESGTQSYLYKYNILSRNLELLLWDTRTEFYDLESDEEWLYIGVGSGSRILRAPLSNPRNTTYLELHMNGSRRYRIYIGYGSSIVAVTLGGGCHVRFTSTELLNIQLKDDILGGPLGHEVGVIDMTTTTSRCHLIGDSDALGTFTTLISGSTCKIILRPRRHLDWSKRASYNMSARVSESCPAQIPNTRRIVIDVFPTASCQAIPESALLGSDALQISVKYPAHLKPLQMKVRKNGLNSPNQFSIPDTFNSKSGQATAKVVIKSALDYEKPNSLLHGFSVELSYCIEITDSNDNVPLFIYPNRTYGSTVKWIEHTKGLLAQVQALDADKGDFGTEGLRFHIIHDAPGYFSIDAKEGIIRVVKDLDREKLSDFVSVVIEVRDNLGAAPYNKAIGFLHVNLIDVNDNTPLFSKALYLKEILEIVHVGRPILTVLAKDSDDGSNGAVIYTLKSLNGTTLFGIDQLTGEVKVTGRLFGKSGTYHLQVTATDGGTPPLSSTVTVVVKVQSITALPGRKRRNARVSESYVWGHQLGSKV